jgi:hypothetical protein
MSPPSLPSPHKGSVDRCDAIVDVDGTSVVARCGAPPMQWLRIGLNLYCRCSRHIIDRTGKPMIKVLTYEEALVLSVQES